MRSAALLVVVFLGAPAEAQDRSRDAEKTELFRKLDANGDGYLSREELAKPAAQEGNWIAVDRDGDGRIGLAEFTVVRRLDGQATAVGGTRAPAQETEAARGAGRP